MQGLSCIAKSFSPKSNSQADSVLGICCTFVSIRINTKYLPLGYIELLHTNYVLLIHEFWKSELEQIGIISFCYL